MKPLIFKDVKQDLYFIEENGDVVVTEQINCKSEMGTEWYRAFNDSNYKYDIISVKEESRDSCKRDYKKWFIEVRGGGSVRRPPHQ